MQTCGCAGEIKFLRQHHDIAIQPQFDAGVHGHTSARRNGLTSRSKTNRSVCEYWVGPVPTHLLIYTPKVAGEFQLVTSLRVKRPPLYTLKETICIRQIEK